MEDCGRGGARFPRTFDHFGKIEWEESDWRFGGYNALGQHQKWQVFSHISLQDFLLLIDT